MAKKKDLSVDKIKYLLSEKGLTFSSVERLNGLSAYLCKNAANCANIKGETAISKALKMHPKDIWPSRYDTKGERLKPQPSKNYIAKPRFRQGLKAA